MSFDPARLKQRFTEPKYLIAVLVGLASALVPLKAGASVSHFGPEWSSPLSISQTPNGSFLADQNQRIRSMEARFLQSLIDQDLAQRKRYEYQRLVDDYERRRAHDVNGLEGQRLHAERMNQFSRSVFNEVRTIKVQREAQKLKTRAENNEDLSKMRDTVEVVAFVAAVVQGEEMVLTFDRQTQLSARTDVPSQKGELKFISPIVNSKFNFVGGAPEYRDPYTAPPKDPTERDERFKLSVSKDIQALALNTGINFGSTTRTVAATFSKQLTDHLTCVFEATNRQDALKFLYKFNF